MSSWIDIPANSDFPLENIPFGVFSTGDKPKAGTRIGDTVIDLNVLQKAGVFTGINLPDDVFSSAVLNDFIELGKPITNAVRSRIQELFNESNGEIRDNEQIKIDALWQLNEVQMHLPVRVGDYTDFYSSIEHATNVGKMFRDPENALLPNWKHIPVGYHGRASSIVVSGTPVHRPKGQTKPDENEPPVFGPCRLLDFELEMAFVTYQGKPLGQSISTNEAEDFIFGMVLFNDWSARDIQAWEYQPLGPFLAKNFASTISPWIVTTEALAPYRINFDRSADDPQPLPYLTSEENTNHGSLDIHLECLIQTEKMRKDNQEANQISKSNFKYSYWTIGQLITHHSVNGCTMRAGDLLGSGTQSGPEHEQAGSMLELSRGGKQPFTLANGEKRTFLEDGDTVIMRGYCQKDGAARIGFGEVIGTVLPSIT